MKHRNQQITFLHILSYFCIDNTDHNIFYDIIRINLYFFFYCKLPGTTYDKPCIEKKNDTN